jgi:hypothetical protein
LPVDLVAVAGLDQLGRAAELCQTPIEAFMDYAGKHGVEATQRG